MIAKVRNFSRHDVIIIGSNRYDKVEWNDIDEDALHEELTIIKKPVKKKSIKIDGGDYGNR